MGLRHTKPFAATLLLVLSMGFLAGAGPAKSAHLQVTGADVYREAPSGVRPSPSSATANQEVDITVTLNQPATSDIQVPVGATDTSVFTSFPSTVTIPAGSSQGTFTVYVVANPPNEAINLTATLNGTVVIAPMSVAPAGGN